MQNLPSLRSLLLIDLKHLLNKILALFTDVFKLNVLVVEIAFTDLSENLICSISLER